MTFERRVAARYLASLLTGATAAELDGRRVSRVAFQQAPAKPVDDLIIYAARDGETDASLELAIAIRRAPSFVTSDTDTAELITQFLRALRESGQPSTSFERHFAVCVAGVHRASREVAELAALAKNHQADSFFSVLRTPRKFRKALVTRLHHLVNLVKKGLAALGETASVDIAERATWDLLSRLYVLMPRVEAPDETDWEELLCRLEPWSRDQSLSAAAALRDRLESLAARYAPNAAVVELPALRRDAHDLLSSDRHRNAHGWTALMRLDQDAREAVRIEMGLEPAPTGLHLARRAEAEALRRRLDENAPCVLVCGESGVGKSALVLSELSAAVKADPLRLQVVFLNLRLMPSTIPELRSAIGCAIEDALREMSAPVRCLVIDAAEYIGESSPDLLKHVVRAAKHSDMGVWIITSTEGKAAVRTVVETILTPVIEHGISFLKDEDLKEMAGAFPQLQSLMANAHSRELLRRPIVADLLVRAGPADHPLSDADALKIVWTKLVRADGRTERGTPDSRDQVFRRLARHQLQPGSASELYESLAPALDGLRRDGLVRLPSAAPWQVLPDFPHELLRTYAICQVLLADGEPVTALLETGAPRWALPAARLAAQVLLAAPENSKVPMEGRFEKIQADFERLVAAGHGQRWSDLPTEAVLPLTQAGEMLGGAWKYLLKTNAHGLRRVLRVIQQRHRNHGLIAPLVAEPVVELLLDGNWPNDRDLRKSIEELLRNWLGALIMANEPTGQPLRLKLRRSIVHSVQQGDRRLADEAAKEAEELAARTPEQIREDEELMKERRMLSRPWNDGSKRWAELPKELIRESTLEKLSLLGADLGEEGEKLLRRVARDAPQHLAPGLEELFAGHGLASYRPSLLTDLVEAYYLDSRDDDFGMRDHDYGIRGHYSRGDFGPLCAYYKGPFGVMFQADFRNGVACLNRLLNHAAKVRVAVLQDNLWAAPEESVADRDYQTVLSITGEPRIYLGDSHVWLWYRGTGVGPYPCMSALQALEVVCDQVIQAGTAPERLATILLQGCENLAMPALVVGLLVRHLEEARNALDPFFTEPMIWRFEFGRVIGEHSGLAAGSDGICAPERRKWSLREAAMLLVLRAGGKRIDSLRKLGKHLIERARGLEAGELTAMPGDRDETTLSEGLAAVHGWAAALDRDSYQVTEQEGGFLIQPIVSDDVQQALEPGNIDLSRGNQATQLLLRYTYERHHFAGPPKVGLAELISDLASARELLSDPPTASPSGPLAAPAAVAAGALEIFFIAGKAVASEDLAWSVQLLVEIARLCASVEWPEEHFSGFSQGPDRSAARGIPFVFLPEAADLRADLGASGITPTNLADAARWLAARSPLEVRLLYAKSMDLTWRAPCDHEIPAKCHHSLAFELLEDSARECLIGSLDFETHRRKVEHLEGPLDQAIAAVAGDKIIVPRLGPAIRALGVAANTPSCRTDRAKALLAALLATHRRGMAAHKQRHMHSASDTLIVARALLFGVANGDEDLLLAHLKECAEDPGLLAELLLAFAAAAEENGLAAESARRIWPKLIDQVLDVIAARDRSRRYGYFAGDDLAALMPNLAYESRYLRRELEAKPIEWADIVAWKRQVERWLPLAAGSRRCVDSLIRTLSPLEGAKQAAVGLPWIEILVKADPNEIASRSFLLPDWLREVRLHARGREELLCWQRIVDMLVVAGDTRVADLSD